MGYSVDLRKKVLDYIKKGHSKKEASKIFNVGTSSIERWEKKEKQGDLRDVKPRRPWKKIDPNILLEEVKKHPGYIMKDFARIFGVSVPSILNAFKVLGITRKKRPYSTKKEKQEIDRYFYQKSKDTEKRI